MPPDADRYAEARAWLVKAADDLRAAEHDLAARPPLYGDVLFHVQQHVEKTLKAFLAGHDVPFRKTHDLGELGRQCVAIDAAPEPVCKRAVELTVYAWIYRYPGDPDPPTHEDVVEALALARDVRDAVGKMLPSV